MYKKPFVLLLTILCLFSLPVQTMAQEPNVTRLDFVKDVCELISLETAKDAVSSFEDVTEAADISYVEAAYQNHIISGYGTTFKPLDPITKEQAITVIVKAFGAQGKANQMTQEQITQSIPFADADTISPWAKPYIAYALSAGILEGSSEAFSPQSTLTTQEAEALFDHSQALYETKYTREGLSALDLLQQASEKLNAFESYKYTGTNEMNMTITGPEQENVHMVIEQEGVFQKPQKVYVKSVNKVSDGEMEQEQSSEVFMDEYTMYMKTGDSPQWIKLDMNPFMQKIQSLAGSTDISNPNFTKEQMALFGMNAVFAEDVIRDEKNYYVIDMDVDKSTFKQVYQQIMDETLGYIMEMAKAENPEGDFEEEVPSEEEIKQQLQSMVEGMNMEIGYRFYIDQETKLYEYMDITQTVYQKIEDLEMTTNSTGEYKYYDLGEPVEFPVIDEKDVLDPTKM